MTAAAVAASTESFSELLFTQSRSPLGALELALRQEKQEENSIGIYYRVQDDDERRQLNNSELYRTCLVTQLNGQFSDKEMKDLEEAVLSASSPTSEVIGELRPCTFKVTSSDPRKVAADELISVSWETLSIYGWLLLSVEKRVTDWKEGILCDTTVTPAQRIHSLTERFGSVEEFCGFAESAPSAAAATASQEEEEKKLREFTWFRLLMLCANVYIQQEGKTPIYGDTQELFIDRKSKVLATSLKECPHDSVASVDGKWYACVPAGTFALMVTERYTMRFCNAHAILEDDFL